MRTLALVLAVAAVGGIAGASEASRLYKQARKAEKAGEVAKAYVLYTEAAALEPQRPIYALRAAALQSRAALQAKPVPKTEPEAAEPDVIVEPEKHFDSPTARDYVEARRPLPPRELKALPGRKDLDFRGDSKKLYEEVAKAYGLDCVFDADYKADPTSHFQIQQADYREALQALQTVTSTFVVPVSDRVFLVVKDTPPKRKEQEPSVSVSIPIPETTSAQDTTQLITTVQQAMGLERVAWDTQKSTMVIRDRVSKVTAARELVEYLLYAKPQVEIEVRFMELSRTDMLNYGVNLPTSWPVIYLGHFMHNMYTVPSGITGLATFGGGMSLFGIGMSNVQLIANMTKSIAQTLVDTTVRSVDGQPATLHIGQRYPILTSQYIGPGVNGNASTSNTTGGAFGSGTGAVHYTIAENTSPASRTGTLVIAGQVFTVTQAGTQSTGSTCIYNLSETTAAVDVTASTGSVSVTTDSACAWTAASNNNWITVTAGSTGTGNGEVDFSVDANPNGQSRTGNITIAGQTFVITQAGTGSNCNYQISPASQSYLPSGTSDTVTITATSGCSWTATSPVNWVAILSGASGIGNGIVSIQVGTNTGEARTARLTIAGQTFLVSQEAATSSFCTYTLSPTSYTATTAQVSSIVYVSTAAGCSWTAQSSVSWITISSGGSINSNGDVVSGTVYTPPPSFSFEDLGFSLKVTPHVHGMQDVTLEIESEFRLLAGAAVNGIPIIANRQLKSTVTLEDGEVALVSGMLTTSEAHTIGGIAGLATLPLAGRFLRQNTTDKSDVETIILIEPRILTVPPTEVVTHGIRVGPEERPYIPL